jgi:hypothetical protein
MSGTDSRKEKIWKLIGSSVLQVKDRWNYQTNLISYDMMTKVANYYLGLTRDKNIIYDNFHTNEKYSDILQIFTDNHVQLKVKYNFYNFLLEKLCAISRVHPQE